MAARSWVARDLETCTADDGISERLQHPPHHQLRSENDVAGTDWAFQFESVMGRSHAVAADADGRADEVKDLCRFAACPRNDGRHVLARGDPQKSDQRCSNTSMAFGVERCQKKAVHVDVGQMLGVRGCPGNTAGLDDANMHQYRDRDAGDLMHQQEESAFAA